MKLFTPDYYVESYRAVDLDALYKRGIRLLVCDIDNTLVAHDCAKPDNDVRAFIHLSLIHILITGSRTTVRRVY